METFVKYSRNRWALTPQNAWKFIFIMVIVGIALLSGGIVWGISTFRFMGNASFSEGIVEKLELRRASRGHVYAPTIVFKDPAGQPHTFTNPGSNPAGFSVGERVRVAYDPSEPSIARIVSFKTLWLFPTIFGVAGILFVLFGSFGTWQARKLYM